jgi:hypothetical protein
MVMPAGKNSNYKATVMVILADREKCLTFRILPALGFFSDSLGIIGFIIHSPHHVFGLLQISL